MPTFNEYDDEQFVKIWAAALAKHEQMLGHRLDNANQPPPMTADALLIAIDKHQGRFEEFRAKRRTLFTVLGTALKPIEMIGKVAAGGASQIFPPSSFVFGAVELLVNTSRDVSGQYDSIIELFNEIKDFTLRLSVHSRQKVTPELRGIVTDILLTVISICDFSAKAIRDGRVKTYFKTILLGKDPNVQAQIANLKRLTESEERMVGALTLAVTTGTFAVAASTNTKIDHVSEQISGLALSVNESLKEQKEETELDRLRNILKPSTTPLEIQERNLRKRLPGTGEWIHNESNLQAWMRKETPILWLHGGPGAGKSFLASYIIQHLTQLYPQGVQDSRRVSIPFWFFKDYDRELQSISNALKSLAYQICLNDPVYTKHCMSVFRITGELRLTETIWRKLFLDFFCKQDLGNFTYMVFDGLDEALDEDRREFLELLGDLLGTDDEGIIPRIQVLLIGRPDLNWDIEDALDSQIPFISVSPIKTSKDIEGYIEKSIAKTKILGKVTRDIKEEVAARLKEGANGMFLWVDLMIKEIAATRKISQIRQILVKLPTGLFGIIRHVLERYSRTMVEEDIGDFNAMLAWIVSTKKPLTLANLDCIMKMKSPDGEGLISLEEDLRKRYASFFTLARADGLNTEDLQHLDTRYSGSPTYRGRGSSDLESDIMGEVLSDTGLGEMTTQIFSPETTVVHLAHASLGEYFRSGNSSIVAGVGVDINKAEVYIVKTCLRLWNDVETWKKIDGRFGYAHSHWMSHLRKVNLALVTSEDKRILGTLLIRTLRDCPIFTRWLYHANAQVLWGGEDAQSSLVIKWLNDPAVTADFLEDDMEWVAAIKYDEEVLRPVILFYAEQWLQNDGWDCVQCFVAIWLHVNRLQGLQDSTPLPEAVPNISQLRPGAILDTARWADFEEDSLWHLRVARVLHSGAHDDEAVEHYSLALKMNDERYDVWVGLVESHIAKKQYQIAVEFQRKAEETLETSVGSSSKYPTVWAEHYERATELHDRLKQYDLAFESSQKSFRLNRDSSYMARMIVLLLDQRGRQRDNIERQHDIIDFMKDLQADIVPKTGLSRLVQFPDGSSILDDSMVYRAAVQAARKFGEVDLIKGSLLASIKSAKVSVVESGYLLCNLALLSMQDCHDESNAIKIWEHVIELTHGSPITSESGFTRLVASRNLATIYQDKALEVERDSVHQKNYIKKLENLAEGLSTSTIEVVDGEHPFVLTTQYTALMLGQLYQMIENHSLARECFKAHVRLGVDLLTDDTTQNDFQGYGILFSVFLKVKDDDNAIAALSLIYPPILFTTDETTEEKGDDTTNPKEDISDIGYRKDVEESGSINTDTIEASSRIEEDNQSKIGYSCDGCNRGFAKAVELHICRVCYDLGFCNDCIKLVKEGKRDFVQCNPKHEFLHIRPLLSQPREGYVRYGDKDISIASWIDQIKRE